MPDAFMDVHRAPTILAADRNNVPAVYNHSHFARDGGLLSYGVDQVDNWRRAATYVDPILRGAKPAELSVADKIRDGRKPQDRQGAWSGAGAATGAAGDRGPRCSIRREVIDLVYYHEKPVDEVAEIIHLPAATVKTRMFYARKCLGKMLTALIQNGGTGTFVGAAVAWSCGRYRDHRQGIFE
jgi:hypothetical protein